MNERTTFVVCIQNEGYPASLEIRKIYQRVPDTFGEGHHLWQVIDESGEDYLYPASFFMEIELPAAPKEALALAA